MTRYAGPLLIGLVVAGGCTGAGEGLPDEGSGPSTTTSSTVVGTTIVLTTTTAAATTTTELPPQPIAYLVVAEESARRLAVIGCEEAEAGPCDQFTVVEQYDLPHRPHNLAAAGSVVLATHPASGAMSRLDVATGDLLTASVGVEPHDVKFGDGVAYVADEAGRELLTIDPATLEVLDRVSLPNQPHDLFVDGASIWVTMLGSDSFAVVTNGEVDLVPTGRAPHDLLITDGRVWFSNWGSHQLDVLDIATGELEVAPAGVHEPHHFALDDSGVVWVSDNGGDSIVALGAETMSIVVGPTPHHLVQFGSSMAVAVSGSGEAVFVEGGVVVARVPLSVGLHGVAVVVLDP